MIGILLKHTIYEFALEQLFSNLVSNFPLSNTHHLTLVTSLASACGARVREIHYITTTGETFNLYVDPDEYSIQCDPTTQIFFLQSNADPGCDFYDTDEDLLLRHVIYI